LASDEVEGAGVNREGVAEVGTADGRRRVGVADGSLAATVARALVGVGLGVVRRRVADGVGVGVALGCPSTVNGTFLLAGSTAPCVAQLAYASYLPGGAFAGTVVSPLHIPFGLTG
jgi:hypothetical protein